MKLDVDERAVIVAPIICVVGVLLALSSARRVIEVVNLNDGLTASAVSTEGRCGPVSGGWATLTLDGQGFECPVIRKCGMSGIELRYDPQNPARCRQASHVGKAGGYELMSLAVSAWMTLSGCVISFVLLRRHRRRVHSFDDGAAPHQD